MNSEPDKPPNRTDIDDGYAFGAFVVVGILFWLAGCAFAGVFTYLGAARLARGGAELAGLMLFTIPITGAACAVAFRLLAAAWFDAKRRSSSRIAFVAIALTLLTGVVWFSHAFESFSTRPTATPVRVR